MSQSIKPPRILFVRPKSAGPVRSHPQTPSSLASTSRPSEEKTPIQLTPPISLTGFKLPQPVRPVSSTARRPSSAVGSRRCFTAALVSTLPLPKTAREADNSDIYLLKQEGPFGSATLPGLDVSNIYQAVVARKDAENTAQQLARRIAHFRTQEERVLSEMKILRTHLETSLKKIHEIPRSSVDAPAQTHQTSRSKHLQGQNSISFDPSVVKQKGASASSGYNRKVKVPRSSEQLEFLAKQKRALETHKLKVARQQKERRKLALDEQKAKQEEQDHKRRCRKERIRAEEQWAIEQRSEKQRQLREAATIQHNERLMTEKQRQHEALNLIAEMEEEERNIRLRLEALHFHREYMEQELCGSMPRHDGT